jgi:hypothetical protein
LICQIWCSVRIETWIIKIWSYSATGTGAASTAAVAAASAAVVIIIGVKSGRLP